MSLETSADTIVEFVRAHKAWAAPIVFVLAFGESMAFVSLVLPFWGILVGIGTIMGAAGGVDFWLILVAAAVGAALGDWLSFWLGYHYGDRLATMWPLNKNPDLLPKGHAFFDRWGPWAIVIGRFSGPLRASVPIVAGAVKMAQTTFQIANWSSAFLWAWVLLTLGDVLGKTWNALRGYFGFG